MMISLWKGGPFGETLIKFKKNRSRFLDFAELPEERVILLHSE
jgi:hypothetical protein